MMRAVTFGLFRDNAHLTQYQIAAQWRDTPRWTAQFPHLDRAFCHRFQTERTGNEHFETFVARHFAAGDMRTLSPAALLEHIGEPVQWTFDYYDRQALDAQWNRFLRQQPWTDAQRQRFQCPLCVALSPEHAVHPQGGYAVMDGVDRQALRYGGVLVPCLHLRWLPWPKKKHGESVQKTTAVSHEYQRDVLPEPFADDDLPF